MTDKYCSKCKTTQPLTNFTKDRQAKDGYCHRCRDCSRRACRESYWRNRKNRLAYNKKYHKENPHVDRRNNLFRHYGITLEQYNRLLLQQKGQCVICNEKPRGNTRKTQNLYVDHDHTTGEIRGLLCPCCNSALGLVKEDVTILRRMIIYLQRGIIQKDKVG